MVAAFLKVLFGRLSHSNQVTSIMSTDGTVFPYVCAYVCSRGAVFFVK